MDNEKNIAPVTQETKNIPIHNTPEPKKHDYYKKRKLPKHRLQLKRARLINRIPELLTENKSVMQLAQDCGYSNKSRSCYDPDIRQQIQNTFNMTIPDLQNELKLLLDDCKKDNDKTNRARAIESLLRSVGGFLDRSRQEITTREEIDPNVSDEELARILEEKAKAIRERVSANKKVDKEQVIDSQGVV